MKKRKTISRVLIVLILLGGFMLWYDSQYSMDKAMEYEVNSPNAEQSLLIATQGSEYKDKISKAIVQALTEDQVYMKIVDIHSLKDEDPDNYTAIVMLHTIEMMKAPKCARDFADRADKSKLFVLATSGDGSYHIEGVDGMTSASPILDSDRHAAIIVSWYRNQIFQ